MVLYKYLAKDRGDVLERRRIRFTQAVALNDPFELQPYFDVVVGKEHLLKQLEGRSIDITPYLIDAYNNVPAETKALVSIDQALAFARAVLDSDEGRRQVSEALNTALETIARAAELATPVVKEKWRETFGSQIGILSLSEVATSPLMWAHYASQHQGYVIGFDAAHPFFERRRSSDDEFFHLRKVIYRTPVAYRSMLDLDGDAVFLVKHPDWSYEQEWRMLAPLRGASETLSGPEPIALFDFPSEAVSEVVVGARCAPALQDQIVKTLATPDFRHVLLRRAMLQPATQSVEIVAS